MPIYNVSSLFIDTAESKTPTIVRKFLIGSSDYTEYVVKWPSINREWNSIKPKNVTIPVANNLGTFNFFNNDPITLTNTCSIQVGFQYTPTSSELLTILSGRIGRVAQDGTRSQISIIDKMKTFAERVVGSRDVPVEFLTSNHLPSDIAWILVTSYGGLDATASTSNVDINYEAFLAWASVFSSDSVFMQGFFDGQKVVEALRKIGRMTESSIIEENGKLNFARFDLTSVSPYPIPQQAITKLATTIDDSIIINRQIVNAAYNVGSGEFTVVADDTVTASINSYGLREQVAEDKNIWYVNSVSALNFAQRKTNVYGLPYTQYTVSTGVQPIARAVGETVGLTYEFLSLAGDTYRIMGYKFDLERCEYTLSVDASQVLTFFRLDVDTYSALDETYNPLG